MLLTFRDCELDTQLFTLQRQAQPCPVEPQVFNLLLHLIKHRDRVVTRQELFDVLWEGKVVSEATLSTCIKGARQAIGDDGQTQACIATVQRRGYRFVAPVTEHLAPPAAPDHPAEKLCKVDQAQGTPPRRPSIAVMPFVDLRTGTCPPGGLAGALAHDVITRLAQLRSLLVIAQGTVFALSERKLPPQEAGKLLGVDYLVSGSLQLHSGELMVSVELSTVADSHIIWADIIRGPRGETLRVLDEIGGQVVAHVASEIELVERNRALRKPPETLDAWEAHHRGLWHMYRFNREDNALARRFFEQAVQLDPTFARAYAGLSFTHFQDAFQDWAQREPAVELAYAAASQGLTVDERNPAAHWAMGRALWLRDQHHQSITELERAVELSPSFALGHYTLAFVHSQTGNPQAAMTASDRSLVLSPFDPLLFGILGSRAMALVRLGRLEEAADCGAQAAALPNAHVHILGIAAYSLALAGKLDEARIQAKAMERLQPGYRVDNFLRAFQFDAEGVALFRQGAARLGMA